MKNILLPFLTFAMVMFVGCTESFVALSEGDVTQPIVKSALDDIKFPANFTIKSTGATSFIIDPKSETISRNNFKFSFGDENKSESGEDYLTAVITESSSINGYTIRVTPTPEAVALSEELIIPLNFYIETADGRKTNYTVYVTLPADNPTFDDHPDDIVFPLNFTRDSMMQTKVRVLPGPYEVGPENIFVTYSKEYMYTHYSTLRDTTDSTGNTYILTLQPTFRAEDYTNEFKTEATVQILYRDNSGARYSVESYPFDITFTADSRPSEFVQGVSDVVFPENFTSNNAVTTYVSLIYGTDLAARSNLKVVGLGGNNILNHIQDEDDARFPGSGCDIAWTKTEGNKGTYKCVFKPLFDASAYPDGLNIPIEYQFVRDTALYRISNGTEGYVGQTARLVFPPFNGIVPPAFVSISKLVVFSSDFTTGKQTDIAKADKVYSFTYNEKRWTDLGEADVDFVIDGKSDEYKNWIEGWEITKTTEALVDATTGHYKNTHSVTFMPTQAAVDYVNQAYVNGYENFVTDSGLVWAYMRVYYGEDADGDGKRDKYIESDKIDFRFMPPSPEGLESSPNMEWSWIAPEDEVAEDGSYKFTWEEAKAICAKKAQLEGAPWEWVLPTQAQLGNVFNARVKGFYSGFTLMQEYWASNETATTARWATMPTATGFGNKTRHMSEKLRVRCSLPKWEYAGEPETPEAPDFN